VPIQASKKYFKYKSLPDIVTNYPFKEGLSPQEIQKGTIYLYWFNISKEKDARKAFIHFLSGLLNPDPERRWTPLQAKNHPFIKGEPFNGTFVPEPTPTIKQTPPKVIPWGIEGGTLSQKPVSMSYPERGMYDNSFSPGSFYGRSFNDNIPLGASPYGMSPFSASPYGFGTPNFQLMKQQVRLLLAIILEIYIRDQCHCSRYLICF
jgi:serine/threonine protein kinase